MNKFTLRPGWLVALSSRVTGGVNYERTNIVEGDALSEWLTKKTVSDPEERALADKVRGLARTLITRQCANTDFGLICSEANESELDEAEQKARDLCTVFNKTAKYSRVSIRMLRGRIESNDAKATKALVEEMRLLIDEMSDGIKNGDPESIRDAVKKAKQVQMVLSGDKAESVALAVAAASKAANTINKRVLKNREDASKVISELQIADLEKARMAFLDMSDDVAVEEQPSVARAVEMDDEVIEAGEASVGDGPTEEDGTIEPILAALGITADARTIEIDEGETRAADNRRDFDAVDVPEVSL